MLTPGEYRKPSTPQLALWVDEAAQTTLGAGNMPDPLPGFAGLNAAVDGGGWPPDTVGDAGPAHYIQLVNISIGIFELPSGNLLYRATLDDFFTGPADTPCAEDHRGDPVVLYDPYVERWLVSDFAWFSTQPGQTPRPGYYQCLAISRGPDPIQDGWYFYALRADTGAFEGYLNDYPKLGAWHDGWYMTANMFQMVFPADGFGVRAWALDRQALVNGQALREVHFDLCTEGDCASLLPAHDNLAQSPVGTPPPNYLISAFAPGQLKLWKFTVDFDAPQNSTLSGPVAIPVAPFATASSVPQLESTMFLDSLSPRLMMQLQYRFREGIERLFVNHTVLSGGVAGVRWYEIQNPASASPLVAQQSTYQPDSNHRWMGSLAVDQDGNLALGYSVSGAAMYPSIRVAGRMAPEISSQLPQAEVEVQTGTGAQEVLSRWGDYSAMTLAPDGCTFYYTTEYYLETGLNWQTWITPLRYPSCGQSKGTLQGVARDAVTLQALGGIPVVAASSVATLTLQTAADGTFSLPLAEGIYTLTAGPKPLGYPIPTQALGVNIAANQITTLELLLTPFPALTAASIELADSAPAGNDNQVPEPGEAEVRMWVNLQNLGSITATQVESQLSSLTPGISLLSSQSAYSDIPPGQTGRQALAYGFSVDAELACGTQLQFQQVVRDSLQTYTTDLDFQAALPAPTQALFDNDVEGGSLLWKSSGVNATWGISEVNGVSGPTHAWVDSPAGFYRNNTDSSLVTTIYNLAGKRGIQVQFALQYVLEAGWDYLFLEYSLDGGETWAAEPLAVFTGYQTTWTTIAVDAPQLDNQPAVALRFRLLSDVYITYDGVTLDDIALTFAPYSCEYPVNLPPAAPVPLAPMGGELFRPHDWSEVKFEWLPGASGAVVEGYRLYVDGVLAAELPASQNSASLVIAPGEHIWALQAYNSYGVSPQAALTMFWNPFRAIFPWMAKP
jgi:hypothetical protein